MAAYDITLLDSALEFDTTDVFSRSVVEIDGTDRVLVSWYQSTTVLNVQAFDVNPSTGAISAIGSPVDIMAGTVTSPSNGTCLVAIDSSNFAIIYAGVDSDGFIQLLSVDGSGNVSTNGSAVEYDTVNGTEPYAILWDSTHLLATWAGSGSDGFAAIFVFDTGAGTISVVGTPLEYDTTNGTDSSIVKLNSTKALVAYSGGTAGVGTTALVLDVNASTYAVTAAGSKFLYASGVSTNGTSLHLLDSGSPMIVVHRLFTSSAVIFRTLSINTTTWAITNFGAENTVYSGVNPGGSSSTKGLAEVDTDVFTSVSRNSSAVGTVGTLSWNSGTGDITLEDEASLGMDATGANVLLMSNGLHVVAWTGTDGDGFIQAFSVELPAPSTFTPKASFFM